MTTHKKSWTTWLSTFDPHETRYVEFAEQPTTIDQNTIVPMRKHASIKHMAFVRETLVAVSLSNAQQRVSYLLKVTRVK